MKKNRFLAWIKKNHSQDQAVIGLGRNMLISIYLSTIAINICMLAVPLYTLHIYDRIISSQNVYTLFLVTAGVLFFIALEFALRVLRGYSSIWLSNCQKFNNLTLLIDKFELGYHTKQTDSVFEKMDVLNANDRVSENRYHTRVNSVIDLTFLALYIVVIFVLSFYMGLFILSMLIVFSTVAIRSNMAIVNTQNQHKKNDMKRYDSLVDFVKSIAMGKLYSNCRYLLKKQEHHEKKYNKSTIRLSNQINKIYVLSSVCTQCIIIGTVYFGALSIVEGSMSLGTLIAVMIISGRMFIPIKDCLMMYFTYQNDARDKKIIQNVLYSVGHKRKKRKYNGKNYVKLHKIQIDQIRLDVTLKQGESVAILAKESCDLEKLTHSLFGVEPVSAGKIRINGQNPYRLRVEDIANIISLIDFSEQIIENSIKENINLYQPVDENTVFALCKQLGIYEDITSLPDGFDTQLQYNTVHKYPKKVLQGICIIRQLVRNPACIVIDPEQNHCDEALHHNFLQLYNKIKQTICTIVVSTDTNNGYVKHCDKHLWLEEQS